MKRVINVLVFSLVLISWSAHATTVSGFITELKVNITDLSTALPEGTFLQIFTQDVDFRVEAIAKPVEIFYDDSGYTIVDAMISISGSAPRGTNTWLYGFTGWNLLSNKTVSSPYTVNYMGSKLVATPIPASLILFASSLLAFLAAGSKRAAYKEP